MRPPVDVPPVEAYGLLSGCHSAALVSQRGSVDWWCLLGEVAEARGGFEEMLEYAGPTGLLSEEIVPGTRQMVGNLPQAFSHVGLINAAWRLSETSGEGGASTPERVDEQ
jgi:hypothetical protein